MAITVDNAHEGQGRAERSMVRAELEFEYAQKRDAIEAKAHADTAKVEDRRVKAHRKNEDAKLKAYADAGLNPDGSDPFGRPRTVIDPKTGNSTTI